MDVEATLPETPDTFLKALGESLKAKEGVDANLAHILTAHILKAAPAQDAIAEAKKAILALADERAKQSESEMDND